MELRVLHIFQPELTQLRCPIMSCRRKDKRSRRKELTMEFILFFTSSFISLERKIFTLQTSSLISTTHHSSCYSPQRTPPSTHDNIIEMHGTYSTNSRRGVGQLPKRRVGKGMRFFNHQRNCQKKVSALKNCSRYSYYCPWTEKT